MISVIDSGKYVKQPNVSIFVFFWSSEDPGRVYQLLHLYDTLKNLGNAIPARDAITS